jgi:Activator of Hsp90 ATPase homolog 1-like protein
MKRTILHVFYVGNDLQSVKHALTTLEGLASWWTKDVSGSPDTGGTIEFRFADVFKPDMKVVESNDTMVQWQCVSGEKEWNGDIFTFAFYNKGKSVMVTFTQEYNNEITDEQYGTFNFNWGYYLHSLKHYCENGSGTPWYNKQQ